MTHKVHVTELVQQFRGIGEEGVNSILLTYFRKELRDPSLDLSSRVFPVPISGDVVFINQLAVRTCLLNNWPSIQKVYPCVDDFEYIVGDSDFMYSQNYPFFDTTTATAHVVERVQDFVDYIFEFIQRICMPCLYQSDDNYATLTSRMRQALEDSADANASEETKRRHLTYFLQSLESSTPASSASLDVVTGAKPNAPPYYSLRDPIAEQGEQYLKKLPAKTKEDFEFSIQTQKIESRVLQMGRKLLEMLAKYQRKPSIYDAVTVVKDLLKELDDKVYFHIQDDPDNNPYIADVFIDGDLKTLPPEEMKQLNEELKAVINDIMDNGKIDLLMDLVRNNQLVKVPFDFMVKGGYDGNGTWRTKFIVYVVGDKMHVQDVIKYSKIHRLGGNKTSTLVDIDVGLDTRSTDLVDFVGGVINEDRSRAEMAGLGAKSVSLSRGEQVISDAATFTRAMYSDDRDKFLGQDQFRAVLLFLGRQSVTENPDLLDSAMKIFTDHTSIIQKLREVSSEFEIDMVLARASLFKRLSDGLYDYCSADEMVPTMAGRDTITDLQAQIFKNVAQYIASFTHRSLDSHLARPDEVPGWEEFMSYRDAVANAERQRVPVTEVHRARAEMARKAISDAKLFRKREKSPLWFWGWMMRKQHHGLMEKTTIGNIPALKTYFKLKSQISDERDRDLFEKTFYNIMYNQLVDDVSQETYAEWKEMATDVTFAFQRNKPRGEEYFHMHPFERDFLSEASSFLWFYAAIWVCTLWSSWKNLTKKKGDDGNSVSIPENISKQDQIEIGRAVLVAGLGGSRGRLDLFFADFMIFVFASRIVPKTGQFAQFVWKWMKSRNEKKETTPRPLDHLEQMEIKYAARGARREAAELAKGSRSQTRSGRIF